MKKCKQLLYYLATHPNATVQFYASNMILNIHSDALSVARVDIFSWDENQTRQGPSN
jgi:hypothetical protein